MSVMLFLLLHKRPKEQSGVRSKTFLLISADEHTAIPTSNDEPQVEYFHPFGGGAEDWPILLRRRPDGDPNAAWFVCVHHDVASTAEDRGMCHYMWPHRGSGETASAAAEGNYADEVIQMFLRELRNTGTYPREYIVKLFGGGCMFLDSSDIREVSARNISAGWDLLAQHGFSIAGEHTGGYGSRVLVFELWSGDVWVRRGQAVAA